MSRGIEDRGSYRIRSERNEGEGGWFCSYGIGLVRFSWALGSRRVKAYKIRQRTEAHNSADGVTGDANREVVVH